MKLADPLPVKFRRETKKWLMQQARTREDRSVSAVVREIIERAQTAAQPNGDAGGRQADGH